MIQCLFITFDFCIVFFSSLQKAYSFSEHMEKGLRGDFEQALLHASKHIKVGMVFLFSYFVFRQEFFLNACRNYACNCYSTKSFMIFFYNILSLHFRMQIPLLEYIVLFNAIMNKTFKKRTKDFIFITGSNQNSG